MNTVCYHNLLYILSDELPVIYLEIHLHYTIFIVL